MILDILIVVYLGYPIFLLMIHTFLSITYYIDDTNAFYQPLVVLFLGLVLPQIVVGMSFVFISKIVTRKVGDIKKLLTSP